MKTENIPQIPLAELKHYPVQVRNHTERQIEEYQKSIELAGQTRPMIIDEQNVVLAGNGLLIALRKMGKTTGWALRYTGITDIQKKKIVLSDNAISSLGKDNTDNITSLITSIGDLDIPGFDADVLKAITQDPIELSAEVVEYGKVNENQKNVIDNFSENNDAILGRIEKKREENEREIERTKVICPNCGTVIT